RTRPRWPSTACLDRGSRGSTAIDASATRCARSICRERVGLLVDLALPGGGVALELEILLGGPLTLDQIVVGREVGQRDPAQLLEVVEAVLLEHGGQFFGQVLDDLVALQ